MREVEVGEAMLSLGGPEWQNAVLGRDADCGNGT